MVVIELVDLPIDKLEVENFVLWDEWINDEQAEPNYERLPFDHPLTLCTVPVPLENLSALSMAGGTLLQQTKELILHTDVRQGDNITYVTTCGWMMWNWLIAALYTGAEVTLFDGFPAAPTIARLWDLIDERGITDFGTSPKFLEPAVAG